MNSKLAFLRTPLEATSLSLSVDEPLNNHTPSLLAFSSSAGEQYVASFRPDEVRPQGFRCGAPVGKSDGQLHPDASQPQLVRLKACSQQS